MGNRLSPHYAPHADVQRALSSYGCWLPFVVLHGLTLCIDVFQTHLSILLILDLTYEHTEFPIMLSTIYVAACDYVLLSLVIFSTSFKQYGLTLQGVCGVFTCVLPEESVMVHSQLRSNVSVYVGLRTILFSSVFF